jgi:rSAM/selenodomain-associated transferase 1
MALGRLIPHQIYPAAQGRCAIGIMIKAPRAGSSKTRLSPPLTLAECAEISRCFLQDTAQTVLQITRSYKEAVGVAVYTPLTSEAIFDALLPGEFLMIPQRGEDLGDRLFHAVTDLFSTGFRSVSLIDADSPTLPKEHLTQMVERLREPEDRVVLGPTTDGGYYAIGLRHPHRALFKGIHWSTETVFTETLRQAATLDLPVYQLPPWHDVDDAKALDHLLTELSEATGTRDGNHASHTAAFLRTLFPGRDQTPNITDNRN